MRVALGAVLVATTLAPIQAARATYPGTADGRLAFGNDVVDPSGAAPDIYSLMPNGTGLQRLTDSAGADICPAYSADGKEIAFCSNRTGAFEIWTMKQNGTRQTQVTSLGRLSLFPDFSPDGSKIVFMSGFFPNADLYVVDRTSGALTRLTNTPGLNGFPSYSPDGSKIAFVSSRSGPPQVWVMSADGSDPLQLTFDAAPKGQLPDWSPDGSRIAYQSAGGNGDIYVMNADGTNQARLTNTSEPDFGAAWSPDGSRIAFIRELGPTPSQRVIMVMNADGSDQHIVAQGSRVPAWQPRGDRLD